MDSTHPHPKYQKYKRLTIEWDDEEMDQHIKHLAMEHLLKGDKKGEYIQEGEKHPLDYIKVADINCKCDSKILYEQLFGQPDDAFEEVMAYKTCSHTLFGAAKRQMKAAPTPEPKIADEFLEYAKNIIETEVGEELTHFGYSYQDWYHHLTYGKQRDMDTYQQYLIDPTVLKESERRLAKQINYEGLCKIELQGTDGKPRMVCKIPMRTKFVMGPVCWALEEIFGHKLQGYCGGKNLTEMSDMINKYIDQGFTKVVEGDGSAFDNTQDITLKRVDHYIYRRISDKVYHCDKALFKQIATQATKTMDLIYIDPDTKKRKKLFTYTILGSVFSGDADTTLCNTIRMALYNRFVNDKAGLVYGQDYICFSKGDDFTVMYKPYVTDEFINNTYYTYFLKANPDPDKPDTRVYGLGQVLKMLDIGGPEIIKFCSLRAWICDEYGHIKLTRDPSKFTKLSKYSRKTKCLKNHEVALYLIDQAKALQQSYRGIEYFDAMAQAYYIKAYQFLKASTTSEHEINALLLKHQNRLLRDRRADKSVYALEENKTEHNVYNIKHREEQHIIKGSYWETVKAIERINVEPYTKKELQFINQHVNQEFNVQHLYMVLGLSNAKH